LEGGWVIGSVHLEVRGTPACRGQQVGALLEGLEVFCGEEARAGRPVKRVLLGGDLNTHTFPRGTLARGVQGLLRILVTPRAVLERQLMEPWRNGREPLFARLRAAGFTWELLNDRRPTASEVLGRVEETDRLPPWLLSLLRGVLGRRLPLRLDWFAARGWACEAVDARAATVGELPVGTVPSDHLPLVVEIPV